MSNEPIHFESFNHLANIFYSSIGLDAYEKIGEQRTGRLAQLRRQLQCIFFFITMANMNVALLSEMTFIFLAFANGNNFVEATMLSSFVGFVIVGDIKIFSIWRQHSRISSMMQDLYALYPISVREQLFYDVKGQLKYYNRFAYAFVLLHELLVWSYNLFPLFNYLIYELWLEVRTVGKTIPYNCWTPFNWHDNWLYYPMYLTQSAGGQTCLSGQLANDLLLSAVAVQLIMHYRQLAKRIESHIAGNGGGTAMRERRRISSLERSQLDLRFLRGVIAYHQQILKLSQAMNDVFGISLFISFVSTSLIICFVLFQITIGAAVDSLLMLAFFLFCSLVQIFLICYYAQRLLEASEYVSSAIYNHNWYDADLRYKKMLLVIMQRAQKAAKLQATSFVIVSMPTMTDLLQISYKGFAVIRTMYAREPRKV